MCSFFFLSLAVSLCVVQGQLCSPVPVAADCRSWGICSCAYGDVCTDVWGQRCGTRQRCHYTYGRRRSLSSRAVESPESKRGLLSSRTFESPESRRSLRPGKRSSSSYKSKSYKSYKSKKYKSSSLRRVCHNEDYCERVVVSQNCKKVLQCERRECSNWCCKPDTEVCAGVALNDLSFYDAMQKRTQSLSKICPSVVAPKYTTWKNRQKNSDEAELKYLKTVVEANRLWSRDVMLPKFHTGKAQGIGEMSKAWQIHCDTDTAQHMNCATYFPRCVNITQASHSDCLRSCRKSMECIKGVEEACRAANPNSTACTRFEDWGPRNGNRDCKKTCGLLYAPPGRWWKTVPTGCADVCGLRAGASGKPGTVTCSHGPFMCDPGTKPDPPVCPPTRDCKVCFPKGTAQANLGGYNANSKATCNGTLIRSEPYKVTGTTGLEYIQTAHESSLYQGSTGSLADNQAFASTLKFRCKEDNTEFVEYGCKETGQFCSADLCPKEDVVYPMAAEAVASIAAIVVVSVLCCLGIIAGIVVGAYFCCCRKKVKKVKKVKKHKEQFKSYPTTIADETLAMTECAEVGHPTAPLCHRNHRMELSYFKYKGYNDWVCDACDKRSGFGCQRWFCAKCQQDFCLSCHPLKQVTTTTTSVMPPLSGAVIAPVGAPVVAPYQQTPMYPTTAAPVVAPYQQTPMYPTPAAVIPGACVQATGVPVVASAVQNPVVGQVTGVPVVTGVPPVQVTGVPPVQVTGVPPGPPIVVAAHTNM